MLGWEFPPFISGGLGTACYGLTKAMSGLGTDIMFVLPRPVTTPFSTHVRLVSPRPGSPLASPSTEFRLDEFEHVTFRTVDAQMANSYQTPAQYALNAKRKRKPRRFDAGSEGDAGRIRRRSRRRFRRPSLRAQCPALSAPAAWRQFPICRRSVLPKFSATPPWPGKSPGRKRSTSFTPTTG